MRYGQTCFSRGNLLESCTYEVEMDDVFSIEITVVYLTYAIVVRTVML